MTARYETLRHRALEAGPTGRGGPGGDLLRQRGVPAWLAGLAPPTKAPQAVPRLPLAGATPRRTTALALLLSAMVLAQHQEDREEL